MSSDEKKLIRPVDLPIYDSVHKPQKTASEAKPEEPSMALEAVKTVRLALQDGWTQIVQAKGQADDIIATGQAHTEQSLAILKEEENLPMRAAFIGGGGFLGLMTAIIRRRRFFGKTLYTSIGAGLFAAMLYPEDAKQIGLDLYEEGDRLSKIAVNFVQGVAPQDVSASKPTKNDSKSKE